MATHAPYLCRWRRLVTGKRKNENARREGKLRMSSTEKGQGDRLTKVFAEKNEELPYGEDFYRRLHANNLVTAAIYQAREQLSRPVFEDLDQWSVSTPRSDLSWESWTISDCASTSNMSIYSSEATSILHFTSGSDSDVSLDDVKVKENEELGGTEFYITLHTRNIVDSAIINAILEVELYG